MISGPRPPTDAARMGLDPCCETTPSPPAPETPADDSGAARGGFWGEGGLVCSLSGKVGGWFSAPERDLAARARDVATLTERHPGCDADLARRFLAARGARLDDASSMIEKHLAWRAENLPVSPDEPAVRAELERGVFRRCGADAQGRPVLLFAANKNKTAERNVDDVIRMMCYVIEEAIASVKERNAPATKGVAESGEPSAASPGAKAEGAEAEGAVEDADKFSLILFAPYGTELDIALVSALASTFQDNYPERLHRLYALPTGILTRVMWEGVRPFLSAGTAAKVVLTSGGHRPREIEAPLTIETLREALCDLDPQPEGTDPWAPGYVSPSDSESGEEERSSSEEERESSESSLGEE